MTTRKEVIEAQRQERIDRVQRDMDERKRQRLNATLWALTYHPLVCITYAAILLYVLSLVI